jgi:hypothetical protein
MHGRDPTGGCETSRVASLITQPFSLVNSFLTWISGTNNRRSAAEDLGISNLIQPFFYFEKLQSCISHHEFSRGAAAGRDARWKGWQLVGPANARAEDDPDCTYLTIPAPKTIRLAAIHPSAIEC